MKLIGILYNKLSAFVIFTIYLLSNCYLGNNSLLSKIYEYLSIPLTMIIVLFYIVFIIKRKKNSVMIFLFLYLFFIAVACVTGEYSSLITFFHIYYPIVGIILYLIMAFTYNEKGAAIALNSSFIMLIFINFLTYIIYPNGMYTDGIYNTYWFFKYDNLHIMMFMPSFLINLIILKKYKTKINSILIYINWIIIVISIFICKSANTIVAFLIIFLFYIFSLYKSNGKGKNIIKNTNNLINIYLVLFVLIVILRMQDIFSWLIIKVLNKDLTFSNRTIIWDRAWSYIKQRPLLGYGIENANIFRLKMGNQTFSHAHNTFLDVIYKGGMISFSFFFCMIKKIGNSINCIVGKYSDILKITFFSLLIMTIIEAREEKMGFYLILFSLYALSIKKDMIEGEE